MPGPRGGAGEHHDGAPLLPCASCVLRPLARCGRVSVVAKAVACSVCNVSAQRQRVRCALEVGSTRVLGGAGWQPHGHRVQVFADINAAVGQANQQIEGAHLAHPTLAQGPAVAHSAPGTARLEEGTPCGTVQADLGA